MEDWLRAPLKRFAAITALSWAVLALYLFINHRQSTAVMTVEMPSWVPFWPWFLLPYEGLMLMTWLLPVVLQDRERFRACLLAYACGFLLVVPWWVLTPTMLPRPPLPHGFWAHAFEELWKIDKPFNVMPCAHAIGPIVAAWFAAREYPAWRWPLIIILFLTIPSIALVWQHRPVDILLGAVAAGIGIAIAESLAHRRRARRLRALCLIAPLTADVSPSPEAGSESP
jgi:hypothetical protein